VTEAVPGAEDEAETETEAITDETTLELDQSTASESELLSSDDIVKQV